MKYGMEGYGLYWYCLELIAGTIDQYNISFELEHDAEIISHHTGIHHELVQEMMTFMTELGLFENNGGTITCMKLAKRLDQSMTSSPNLRRVISQLHDTGKLEHKQNHDSVMTKSSQIRIDKNRLDENRIEKKRGFRPPSVNEVQQYCNERNNSIDPQAFVDHYETNGWMRGKTKIKNWKACVRTWEKNTSQENKGSIQRAMEAIERAENDIISGSKTGNGQDVSSKTGLLPKS